MDQKTRRLFQNLGEGVLYFSDLLKPQEKTDFRGVQNVQKTYAVNQSWHILSMSKITAKHQNLIQQLLRLFAPLYFGHNNIFGSFGQFR